MNIAVIGIGSNIEPDLNIQKAIQIIARHHEFIAASQIITTKPVGYENQPDFLNGAILISTKISLKELGRWLKSVERDLGRIRTKNRYGPRTVDLDILVWNRKIVDKDVFQRDFLRDALKELLPDLEL